MYYFVGQFFGGNWGIVAKITVKNNLEEDKFFWIMVSEFRSLAGGLHCSGPEASRMSWWKGVVEENCSIHGCQEAESKGKGLWGREAFQGSPQGHTSSRSSYMPAGTTPPVHSSRMDSYSRGARMV